MSESSLSGDDGVSLDRRNETGGGSNNNMSSLMWTDSGSSSQAFGSHGTHHRAIGCHGASSPGGVRASKINSGVTGGGCATTFTSMPTRARTMSTSKSEGHISEAKKKGVRLPRVKVAAPHPGKADSVAPRRRGRHRDMRLPPPGGHQNTATSGVTKEMEAQIADLRARPHARRALEARVRQHFSKRSKRYNRCAGGGGRKPSGDGSNIGSNEFVGSAGNSNATIEPVGQGVSHDDRSNSGWQHHKEQATDTKAHRLGTRGFGTGGGGGAAGQSVSGRPAEDRLAAQTLRAQEVLRRKRAIEDERNKQVRERSVVLQHEARRDKRLEKKRAEKLITYVYCAVGFAEWKVRFDEKRTAKHRAERKDHCARILQRVWRFNRIRRTIAQVRESTPAVRTIVFSMRRKAAVARKTVARRHKTQAADLIRCALRAGTRTLFRTRISYYRDRIIKCQRLFTSYRDVTKARKRALTNKWTRHVHKVDERRFSMYSAHLRDMYNFDPVQVEGVLKEMRLLSAQGQTTAQAMKTKIFLGTGDAAGNHAATRADGGNGTQTTGSKDNSNDENNGIEASREEGVASNLSDGESVRLSGKNRARGGAAR
ncbi:unnamed protein product [Ectocarpus sp. 12 AP-2014]